MSAKRLGLLSLLYHTSGKKNYLADPNSTVEQLAVGYFCQYKSVTATLDSIEHQLNLNGKNDWQYQVKKLFKTKSNITLKGEQPSRKKIQKDSSFVESDNLDHAENDDSIKVIESKDIDGSKTTKRNAVKNKRKSKENTETNTPSTVDEFFITTEGTSYMSTAVNTQNDNSNNVSEHKSKKAKKPKHSKAVGKFEREDTPKKNSGKQKWNNEKDESIEEEKSIKEIDSSLHPSWIAKQKQKPTITEFKGSRITFD